MRRGSIRRVALGDGSWAGVWLELATARRRLDPLLGGPGYKARLPEGSKIAGTVVLTGAPLKDQNVRTRNDDIAAAQGRVVQVPIVIGGRIELYDWRRRPGYDGFPLMRTTRRPNGHIERFRPSRVNLRRRSPEHGSGQFIEEPGRVSGCHKNKGAQANAEQPANSSAVHGANPRDPSCWLTPPTAGGSNAVWPEVVQSAGGPTATAARSDMMGGIRGPKLHAAGGILLHP